MISPTLAGIAGASAVLTAAVAWVRPVALIGRARPRRFDDGRSQIRPAEWSCPAWFVAAAGAADLPAPVGRWWWAGLGANASVGLAGLALGGPILALLATGGGFGASLVGLRGSRHRRDQRLARSVPDSLDAVARATRSGSSVVQALASLAGPDASPADEAFASVAARVDQGESLRHALGTVADTHPVHAVRMAVAALLVGAETGAAPGRAVEGVAATLRDRAALDREAEANASQARASVAVLVLAPLGFGVFAVAADPRVGDFLFRTWIGWLCLAIGLGLDALGWCWMRSIMRNAR